MRRLPPLARHPGVAPSASAPRPPGRRRASARRRRPPLPGHRTPPAAAVVPDLSRFQVRGAKEVGSKVTFVITGTVKQYEVATFSLVNNLGRR